MAFLENSITNRQMVFVIFSATCCISQFSLPKMLASSAGQGGWITLLITGLLFAIMAVIIAKLNNMYQGKVMYEYSGEIAGKPIAFVIAVLYIIYFLCFSAFYSVRYIDLIHGIYLTKTPLWFFCLLSVSGSGLAAYKGITNIARAAEIIGIIFLSVTTLLFAVMLFEGRINRILPLFRMSQARDYVSATKYMIEPFLGLEILLVIPFTEKNKKAPKAAFFTMLGIACYYILLFLGTVSMVGINAVDYYSFPSPIALQLIHFPPVVLFQRIDLVFGLMYTMGWLLLVGIFYIGSVELLCRLVPKAKRIVIVLIAGALIFILSLINEGFSGNLQLGNSIAGYSGAAVVFIIPLLLFIIAKVKKHVKKA